MRIDFVSDITCPWCAIGLQALLQAIPRVADTVTVELHLQPFELNPGLPYEGEPIADYAARKYGAGTEQLAERQALIRQCAAAQGQDFLPRTHVYNTFDAHRLLHWAASQGRQLELKRALLRAYHERGQNPASPEVLLAAAGEAGLDRWAAGDAIGRGSFAEDVRSIVLPLAAAGHRQRAGDGHRRPASDPGRPVRRGLRTGAAALRAARGLKLARCRRCARWYAQCDRSMRPHTGRFIVAIAFTLGAAEFTRAQPGDAKAAPDTARAAATDAPLREGRSRFFDPEDGQFDLSYFLENPRGFLPIPIVITEPAVGYGGGAAGMFLRPRHEAGQEGWSRPDISGVGAFATQNGTWGVFAGDASLWLDGRLKTLAGIGTGRVNLDFYGQGLDLPVLERGVRYSLQFSGAVAQASWQLAPKSPWWLGLRYVYADVDPMLRDDALLPGLAEAVRVKISAPTAIVEFDTRDNVFTPTQGLYAETSYLASREALGASDDFERFQQVLMGWYAPVPRVTLGARGNYAWSSSGTPFFLKPFIMLRGVPAMRYQGQQMSSAELEARWQFASRWSVVAFGGAGMTRTSREAFTVSQDVASGGVGFRYELARKFGLHAGIDIAHSPGTTAVYFQVGNAWFRP